MSNEREGGLDTEGCLHCLCCLPQQKTLADMGAKGFSVTPMPIAPFSSEHTACTSRIFSYSLFWFGLGFCLFTYFVGLELLMEDYLAKHIFQTWFNVEGSFEKTK